MPIRNFSGWFSRKLLAVLFILAITPTSLVTAGASRKVPVSAYLYLGFLPLSSQTQSPRLLTQNNSTRALALSATTFLAEPFSLTQLITFGTDSRTRLVLFATNIDVPAGGNPPALTADAEDWHHSVHPLQVEHVERLGVSEPTYAIHVRLNDAMVEDGDVLVRLYFNGVPSNRVRVGLGRVGGGLPDDGASQITQLSPSSITAGGNPFTLSISGSGFTPDAKPFFNGIEHAATIASESLLLVPLSASEVQTAGTYSIHVQTSAGVSNSVSFNVNNPQPGITGLSPSNVIKGGSGFTLSVSGSGFVQGSVVHFNGSSRVTAFVSATLLTAQILASDLAGAGSFPITVVNPAPGGGTSAAIQLSVEDPTPSPTPSPIPSPTPSGVISYAAAIGRLSLAPSKTAYYRFTETSGTSIADTSGGSHTGTLSGAAMLNQTSLLTGDPNPSPLFDGGKMVSTGFMPLLTRGISMACLFKPTAWPGVNARYLIVGTGTNGTTGQFQLYYQNQANVFGYSFITTTGASMNLLFPTLQGTYQLDRTYHIAVTHDFVSGTVKLYLDGLLVSTVTLTPIPRTTSNQPVQVAYDNVHGFLDEVLVTGDRVLTDTDIRSLMRASVGADQSATQFYVSTTGSYRNPGSISSPIDIYTAARSGLAAPGETYWIRGGNYKTPTTPTNGLFWYAEGTSGNPIRFKEYPGERVIIDGVNQALGGTTSTAPTWRHNELYGDYMELWNVEITNSNADVGFNRAHARPVGINVYGNHIKLIGVWVYDTSAGVFLDDAASDFEMNGCLIFNNGWFALTPNIEPTCNCDPSAHNIYAQNSSTTNRKLFKNSVLWGAADLGFQGYGTTNFAAGMDIDGLVSFQNGIWHGGTTVAPNIGFVALKRMNGNTITNSVSYIKSGLGGSAYTLGKTGDPHENFTFTGNKAFGGSVAWYDVAHATISNNLFVDTRSGSPSWYFAYERPRDYSANPLSLNYSIDHAYSHLGLKGDWTGTGNTYAGANYSSTTQIWNENQVSGYNLAEWQSVTNIDLNATIRNTTTTPYTTPLVYYFPNTYETGKGFAAIYNARGNSTASIDLHNFGLVSGQAYAIYDVMNPFVVTMAGTYSSSSPTVSISMTGTSVRAPLGYTPVGTPASKTSTEFKTFMVVPQ